MTAFLNRLVDTLADAPHPTGPIAHPDVQRAAASLTNLIRQAPMPHDQRVQLLAELDHALPGLQQQHAAELVAAAAALSGAPLRTPIVRGARVRVPSRYGLDEVFATLVDLDESVPQPWTLIGGLMTMVHGLENDAPYARPTTDADIAVSVFTHRDALASFTDQLRTASFLDQTPQALRGDEQLSYRWVRGEVKIDVAVPPKTNDQPHRAVTVTGRPSVEPVATQQALRRTERLPVRVGRRDGYLRRPDLLGAIVIKSAAAIHDRREPERHREDLVTLADILAFTGRHMDYAPQLRNKDKTRIRAAAALITDPEWRGARDPRAARAALHYLLG